MVMKRLIVPDGIESRPDASGRIVRLLPEEGNLYKVNLHTHSTVSDGSFSPEELKRMYMAQGYSALAYTDHCKCVPHTELTDENFVALTGYELDYAHNDERGLADKIVHINAVSRNPLATGESQHLAPLDFDRINRDIAELVEKDFIVSLNHPVFSNMSTEDVMRIHGFQNMELTNAVGTMFNNYSDDTAFYEYFLRSGGRARPVAVDDCHLHFPDGSPFLDYYQGFTVIKAPELTYDALIAGIDSGAMFASTGPMFKNLWLEGHILHVECTPVCGVFVHVKYPFYKAVECARTDCLTHFEVDISPLKQISPYIWVQLRDSNDKKAWSCPYWFE